MAEYIANTSPLSYLHRAGLMDLIPALLGRVIVPAEVDDELRAGRDLGYDLPEPAHLPWVSVRPSQPVEPRVARFARLGPGERAVLTMSLASAAAVAIIDDLPARRAGHRLGVAVVGTLNLLVAGKRRKYLDAVTPGLDRLQSLGFRVAPALRQRVLAMAGEE